MATSLSRRRHLLQHRLHPGGGSRRQQQDHLARQKLGIDPAKDNIEDVPVMTLGTGSISPLEMAAAYATFANSSCSGQPIAITEIDSGTRSVPVPGTRQSLTGAYRGRGRRGHRCICRRHEGRRCQVLPAPSVFNQPLCRRDGHHRQHHQPLVLRLYPQLACALWTGYSRRARSHPKVGTGPAGRQHQPACL